MIMNSASNAGILVPDAIVREISIDATIDVVWELVSEPGWWINEGEIRSHRIEPAGDDRWNVTDEKHGDFLLEAVASDRPRSVAFRWLAPEGQAGNRPDTVVTFTLDETEDGTLVRVVESGFAAEPVDESRRDAYQGNSEGWEIELAAAKAHLEK
jgi:uncharacterized protein YndB with AHSA1/START domain